MQTNAGWRPLLRSRVLTVLGLVAISSAAHVAVDGRHELPRVHRSSISNAAFHRTGCGIKGNINERGEHIFHAPGQENHLATRIDPARGERWFCSQWEVWWAGWRKVKV